MRNHLNPTEADHLRNQPFTYPEVGASLGTLPNGYYHLDQTFLLGEGVELFKDAGARVLHWQVQRGAGLQVSASSDEVVEGAVAIVRIGPGPFAVSAPVRVVRVVDEPERIGFAYGTLAGHPECGEEAFIVELGDDNSVVLRLVAFSRPGTWLSKVGGPAARLVQRAITRRYGRALLRS